MRVSEILDIVQNKLTEDGVYRSRSFLLTGLNDGYRLSAVFALFNEKSAIIDVNGSRNYNLLPNDAQGECFAPLYVANANTGKKVNPVSVDEFPFYSTPWLGKLNETDGESLYYTLLSPYHSAFVTLVLCPIQNIGRTQLKIIGAYVPKTLTEDSTPEIPEEFTDVLIYYTLFYAFSNEPGRSSQMLENYKLFGERLSEMTTFMRARFPGGRDYEPRPIEFTFSYTPTKEQQYQEGEM